MPLSGVPAGEVNVHGHVNNQEALRPGPFINICVEHTGYRPLPLEAIRAARRLEDPRPRGATTIEETVGPRRVLGHQPAPWRSCHDGGSEWRPSRPDRLRGGFTEPGS